MAYLLQHLLQESVDRQPDALAIRLLEDKLSYGELERKSNQLARALVEAGVAPGDRVGLHLRKTCEAIVGVFGILKTGACYVPMDANAPGARIADIIEQCAVEHLITSKAGWAKIASLVAERPPFRAVVFAGDLPEDPVRARHAFQLADCDSLPAGASGQAGADQDLAYILCTSGSTGKPKGVMLSHLNALTFVNWAHKIFQLSENDRFSSHAPLIFDLSIFDIFAGIKSGGSISLIPEGLATIPTNLSRLIEEHQISVWYSVPSVLTLLLLHGKLADRDLSALRLILFAGEVFPVKYLRALTKALPDRRYANLYGPTETNVCTYYEVGSVEDENMRSIPIGKACANTEVIAIDEKGERVTRPGQEGLLYARGSTVMQGYFGRPTESAAAFIKNPFAVGREEMLYCTGDWVTLDENGDILFLGRKDHQIKTRGYRVELSEIEAALLTNPSIREAIAVPIPNDLLGNTIKVFVVPEDSVSLDEQEVKRHCAQTLPRYMVPETVEFRAALPRTATDKVDRPRLLAESLTKR